MKSGGNTVGKTVYPTLNEYYQIINHLKPEFASDVFADGNKRIAAACFLHFLNQNGILFKPDGQSVISNEALAALTLFVAVSKPEEKDTALKLIISILNNKSSKS